MLYHEKIVYILCNEWNEEYVLVRNDVFLFFMYVIIFSDSNNGSKMSSSISEDKNVI